MNNRLEIHKLEANLERMRGRLPDLPVSAVLLTRMLLHLGRGMTTLFENEIRPFGLAEPEFRVLTTLFSQPDGVAHPSELCAHTSQSPANMSRICDALVKRDLITRVSSVADRRKMVLRITEHGEEVVRQLLPRLYVPMRDMLDDVSEAQLQNLVGQLKGLGVKLDEVLRHYPAERNA